VKKRLFIAIELPQEIKEKLKIAADNRLRIVIQQNLHITFLFLGYVEEKRLEEIKKKIWEVSQNGNSFKLKLEKIIYAPPKSTYKMIWALFEKNAEYAKLNQLLAETLKEFKPDIYKDQLIHITLARSKKPLSNKDIEEIKLPVVEAEELNIEKIILYESLLRSSGPIYKKLEEFPFKNE